MKRREFLVLPSSSLGGTLIYSLAGEPRVLQAAQQASESIRVPLRFFTEAEAQTVAAACERILPRDESGPGAADAGVAIYIDRQLAGPYGRDRHRYTQPPFAPSFPEHGYQGKENPREIYRSGIAQLNNGPRAFTALTPAGQDEKLRSLEKTLFFQLLRTHTIEGFLCDPLHGGNAGLIGWQLVGYPGPLMSYRGEIDRNLGQPWRRDPKSLAQILGRPVRGWEDE